uniref:Vitellogenin n=1 Tax=Meloidogyne incognita TaxID=6306 RepID=A0A914LYJ6_MELIC
MPCSFKVTKSINFKQCSRVGDISAGFQTEQPQARCAQCKMDWYKQKERDQQQTGTAEHPCAKCDPKRVKEETLDRQTVMRAMLKCGSEQQMIEGKQQEIQNSCQLDSSEMRSIQAKTNRYPHRHWTTTSLWYTQSRLTQTLHASICLEMKNSQIQQIHHSPQYQKWNKLSAQSSQDQQVPTQTLDNDESLVYTVQTYTDFARFYMFGDEEFPDPTNSPFSSVPKVEQAGQALRALVQSTLDHHHGIGTKHTIQLSRLVEMLRMCSYEDLKQIEQNSQQYHQNQQQTAKQILVDAMAISGTRNCVVRMAEIINNQEVSPHKAAYTISQLTGLQSPSNLIVKEVQKLCQSEQVKNRPIVQQSACLTFGALVNELCSQRRSEKTPDLTHSIPEQCTEDKKEQYKQVLVEQYEKATTLQEKLNALASLGNAGIDTSTPQLEQIIKDRSEHSLSRAKAIDALRRLTTKEPMTLQHMLLPIYLNSQEDPNVRIVALQILMRTQPEPSVIDQIIYTMSQEPNKRVKAYTYQTMKMVAKSKNPADRQMSKHVKNAMQSANVDEQQLWSYAKWQIPVYSPEQEEGIFLTLATEYSQRSWMPSLSYMKIDSYFKDQSNVNDLVFYLMKNQPLYSQDYTKSRNRRTVPIRIDRRKFEQENNENTQQLKNMDSQLGIKSRHGGYSFNDRYSGSGQQQQQQHIHNNNINVFCTRIGDVDHSCFEIQNSYLNQTTQRQQQQQTSSMPTLPPLFTELIQSIQNRRKPSLAKMFSELKQLQQQKVHQYTIASILNDKEAVVPTCVGLPLGIANFVPTILNVEGNVNLQKNTEMGVKVQINGRIMGGMAHIQKMRCWTPFLVSGIKSIRSIEINIPTQLDINVQTANNGKQSLTMSVKLPKEKTRLVGAHSHPYVYTADVDPKTGSVIEPRKVRTITNPKLDRLQYQMNTVIGGKNLGIPVNVHAHYHWPSSSANIEQICKMLMATENAIHVTYQPRGEESAKEVVFQMNLESFQPTNNYQLKMNDFYLNKFKNIENEEEGGGNNYEEENEQNSKRQQKMSKFLTNYSQQQQKYYKHNLEMSAKTVGGPEEFKFQTKLEAKCEEGMQTCQLEIQAERSPINEEQQKWTLKAQAEMVMPENVENNEEFNEEEEENKIKNNLFSCKANCYWGSDGGNKQTINVRINGEQSTTRRKEWNSNNQQRMNKEFEIKLKRRTAFINKFNCEAKYTNLKPTTRNAFERALELVKSKYFWNTKSQLIDQSTEGNPANGEAYLNIVIDPITQKHANMTVKTPEQLIRFQQIELPIQMRPFPLLKQQNVYQNIQSFGQFLTRQEVESRAECSVDGQTVETFDEREYRSPLSTNCYSVLAKDCGADYMGVPRFVVLMKAIERGNKYSQKKLKIISPQMVVECQRESLNNHNSPIKCKINGKEENNYQQQQQLIQYNNQMNDLIINWDKLAIRFNGFKAWIKISSDYRNTQCGLCGHYDDASNDENELLMANNEIAPSLTQFHRSYSLSNSYDNDDKLCNAQELDKFYEENSNKFGYLNEMEEEEREEGKENKVYQNWDEEGFDGNFDRNEENKRFYNEEWYGQNEREEINYQQKNQLAMTKSGNRNLKGRFVPILIRTKIMEMENDICFSKQPIKQCPLGSYPTGWEFEERENNSKHFTTKNIPFICLPRSDSETRNLLNQYRQLMKNGNNQQQLELNNYKQHSIVEKVLEPKECRRL